MIIVKFPKNQDFTPSLENIVLEKLQVGIKLTPSLLKVKSAPSRNIILRHNSLIFWSGKHILLASESYNFQNFTTGRKKKEKSFDVLTF